MHFGDGELWLAMMPDSRKADDLRRDPRFSLHSAPDVSMVDGDAKVGGRAIVVDDGPTWQRFVDGLPQSLPDSGMALFRADLTDASLARVAGRLDDHRRLAPRARRRGRSAGSSRRKAVVKVGALG